MRIMTCNIWGDYFQNPAKDRMDGYIRLFADYAPDIVGFQECTRGWYDSGFFEAVSDRYDLYRLVQNNFTPILVKKERFTLSECGFHLYSQTPDKSKSYTYLILTDTKTEKNFGVINTHFWWKIGEEHNRIRCQNVRELSFCAKNITASFSCPVYAFGDLNCRYHEEPFGIFSAEGFSAAIERASIADTISSHHGDPILGADGHRHGKPTENDKNHSLDHILILNPNDKILRYAVVQDDYILDSSDHSPVFIDTEEA